MKNKRGDIAITILVLGVFLVCTYALISFSLYNKKEVKNMEGINVMENISSQVEKYYLYQDVGYSEEQIATILGMKIDALGKRYLYAEKVDKDKKIISVKYFPK